jgi:hypothetical protein
MSKSPEQPAACENCSAPLAGRFCSTCGQRALDGLPTVSHLLEETAEMLTHADSRLWRTLVPLLVRPGRLTTEYITGHRARYLPPLRLYLALSVLFFVVMGLGTVEPQSSEKIREQAGEAARAAQEAVRSAAQTNPRVAAAIEGARALPGGAADAKSGCERIEVNSPGKAWIEPRLRAACARAIEDGGREFGHAIEHNLGRAMFVFLPLIAGAMGLLYLRPRRLYVEHLLLLVHNHAATFLLLSLAHLLGLALPWEAVASSVASVAGLYLVYYYFRSMRVVYGQGRTRTLAKFSVLAALYGAGMLVMLVLAALFSALTL